MPTKAERRALVEAMEDGEPVVLLIRKKPGCACGQIEVSEANAFDIADYRYVEDDLYEREPCMDGSQVTVLDIDAPLLERAAGYADQEALEPDNERLREQIWDDMERLRKAAKLGGKTDAPA